MEIMIPKAEEFLDPDWSDGDQFNRKEVCKHMIEFAKMHVEAALKAAAEDAYIEDFGSMQEGTTCIIDEDSILDAYPLTNIK